MEAFRQFGVYDGVEGARPRQEEEFKQRLEMGKEKPVVMELCYYFLF